MSGNGPAFPGEKATRFGQANDCNEGMDLRLYYAGQALMGFCANPAVHQPNPMCGWSLVNITEDQLALICAAYADNLIAALTAARGEGNE